MSDQPIQPTDSYATSDPATVPPGSKSTATFHPDETAGAMIGPYKLLQLMGKGGMGAVWMAEQTEPVQRRVALKIIKAGMEGDQILARFEAERQALAMMDHPNIAKVLDAGTIPPSPSGRGVGGEGGRPYFVMELVKGISFTTYCDQEHLTPKLRLELFIPVCNAVQHAHQKGIIHRDLKPSNVLIALYDGKPVPKVIDFGIAKATNQKLTERTMFTEVGQIIGTLEYMAPEQAELNNLDIDTRADIYSLGVMLYELLTGSLPFSGKQLRGAVFVEMLRLIREVEPTRPSTKLSKSDELPAIAAKRNLEPRKLTGMVQGDLDWIVMKCLEKDRGRRYETANQLGQELQRYLADEPVQAGPPSVAYRARKFLRRNKGPVMAAALVVLALIAGIIGTSLGLIEADRATEKALTYADKERRAAHATHAAIATSARDRARRGDWIAALPEYDRVIQDGEPDSLRLRIERLVAYFALNNIPRLVEELDALESVPLGDMEAQVKLIRAAWLLCDVTRQVEGRALAKEVLKNRRQLFSKADEAYAEALAAERVGQAISALRKAADADPMHYLATSSLVVALAAVGDLDEARRQARFTRGVFPFSPAPDIADALVALMEDNPAALKKHLADAAAKVPAERRPGFVGIEKYLLSVNELQKVITRMASSDSEFAILADSFRAGLLLSRIQQAGQLPDAEPLGLPIPAVSLFHRRFLEVNTTYVEVGSPLLLGGGNAKLLPRLKVLNDDYPDAGLLLLTAAVHITLSVDPLNRGKIPEARKHLDLVVDSASLASRTPSLLPQSSIPYLARCVGVGADLGVLRLVPDADPSLQRVRKNLHSLVSEGDRWPKLRQSFLVKYVDITTVPLVPRQCGEWKLNDPAGKAAFEKRRQDLATLARILLDDWALTEPKNPTIPRLRGNLVRWLESSGILDDVKDAPPKK